MNMRGKTLQIIETLSQTQIFNPYMFATVYSKTFHISNL